MSLRPIDRKLLASFIEYVANGVIKNSEWERFAVNHYNDEIMEAARRECVRICIEKNDPKDLPQEDKDKLYKIARELRNVT